MVGWAGWIGRVKECEGCLPHTAIFCSGDTRGNIAAFTPGGEEVWARHVKSLISQVCEQSVGIH